MCVYDEQRRKTSHLSELFLRQKKECAVSFKFRFKANVRMLVVEIDKKERYVVQ